MNVINVLVGVVFLLTACGQNSISRDAVDNAKKEPSTQEVTWIRDEDRVTMSFIPTTVDVLVEVIYGLV